jgi:NAD(P)-dependent dehydrogenase (short-subunit alcohol dehydrogenase family)
MDLTLTGKVALVTGASRGIGAGIAAELARAGCAVALAARSGGDLRARQGEIAGAGGRAFVHARDLREPAAAAALVEATLAEFGRLDIVVANAGATRRGDFLTLDDDDWHDGFALKFFAHMRLLRAAWRPLAAAGGSVVIIAGIGGRTPGADFAIGGAVNAALLAATKALADRGHADGIQVNAINPGDIRTDRFAKRIAEAAAAQGVDELEAERRQLARDRTRRIGEPAGIAGLVRFIVSRRGSFLNGAIIDMDGGKTKTM